MSEPQFSVEGVFEALAAQPERTRGGGRAIMFIAARRKEGTTSSARAVAQAAGPAAVYAIDLDLRRNALAKALAANVALGPKIDGRLNGASFYTLQDAKGRVLIETRPAFTYHRVARSRLFAGVFDTRTLPEGARVQISAASKYWDNARAGGATVVVDAPALDRSQIGLRVARHMDGVVLVVGSDPGAAPAALTAKASLLAAGANLIGLVYAGASAPVLAIEKLLRQAG
jgi:hypothetical protein